MLSLQPNNKKRRLDYKNHINMSLQNSKAEKKIKTKSKDITNKTLLKLLLKEIQDLRQEIRQIDHLKQIIEDKDAIILDLQKELELTRKDNQQPSYYY
tara:strand:- start:210 stop:503 length:294 start_codon:yes stop_codon:yes gene_type:complete